VIYVLGAAVLLLGLPTIYLAFRYREYRKFLAGAFFVSWGIQLYFYFAKVTIPLVGTDLVFSPETSGARSCVHFVLFAICLYFGFFWKPKPKAAAAPA
jgi:uncharacterized protein (DUF486 family)